MITKVVSRCSFREKSCVFVICCKKTEKNQIKKNNVCDKSNKKRFFDLNDNNDYYQK